MKYTFAAIADIHWGAMDSGDLYDHLQLFLDFIHEMHDEIDIVVLCGDYFDYRLQLNSKTAIRAIKWFDEMVTACKKSNVKKIRIIKGTKEHDNDQLEALRPSYVLEDEYLKIFNTLEIEETLPGLTCLYAPDEPMNLSEYHRQYMKKLLHGADIGFFHGNFDLILPQIEFDRIQSHKLPSMIYEYNKFSRIIKGPLIAGHWHTPQTEKSLYYIGSYDRWRFNEEDPKGFIFGSYDTSNNRYYINRVQNILAKRYDTLIFTDERVKTPEHFANIQKQIDELLATDSNLKLRVSYILTYGEQESLINFNSFQKKYIGNPRVKIDTNDLIKKAIKKERREQTAFEASKYQYIFDSNVEIAEKIRQFILEKKSINIPVEDIKKRIEKYISPN